MSTPQPGVRPAPQTTQETAFFWASGRDGRLRFQACAAPGCGDLIHPPRPVCPHCRGHATEIREVSGRATLIGFTVNHRFPFPGLPTPFVVAQVAIEEDPRVRLTTNTVDCAPDELRLGMRMEVVFERVGTGEEKAGNGEPREERAGKEEGGEADAVWLPLFRPCAEQPPPAPLPADEPVRARTAAP
ncbi:OB-fold domain-containing protein, partial [Streptomyces sp. NPDC006356]